MAQLSLTRLGCKFQSTICLVVVQHQVFSRIVIQLMLVCDLECYLLCCLLSNFLISNSYNLSRNLKTPKHSQLVDHLLSDPGSHNTEISAYRLKGEHFFSFQINLLQIAHCIFILLFCVRQFQCFLMLLYCIVNGLQRGFCLFNSCCQTKVGKKSLLIHVQI